MTHVMHLAASRAVNIQMSIKSLLEQRQIAQTEQTKIELDKAICLRDLPYVLDMLDDQYQISLDRSDALNLSILGLAAQTMHAIADKLHSAIVDAIDNVVRVHTLTINPLTRLFDDLSIDPYHMKMIGMAIEARLGVSIPDEKLHEFTIFAEFENYISSQLPETK